MKTLTILILLFNGTLIKEKLEFERPVSYVECMKIAEDHREAIATHQWIFRDIMKSGWYLNDGRGTIQGFICE